MQVLLPGPANKYVLFPSLADQNVLETLSIKAHWNGTAMMFPKIPLIRVAINISPYVTEGMEGSYP